MNERRAHARFDMVLPVLVKASDGDGEGHAYTSRLENISASGLFLKLDNEIPVGSPVTAIVTLADDTNLAVVGEVVRSSTLDGTFGLAVRYSEYHFDLE